jgi:hypothetical protein
MSKGSGSSRKLMDWQARDLRHGPLLGILATTYELDPTFVDADLLPALLGLGAWDDRSWASVVEREQGLAGLESAVIMMDGRRYRGRPRSPRVEIHPVVGVGGQLLHAKVLVAVHEKAVRFQLGSANLTEAGYRENREVVFPLVATADSPETARLVLDGMQEMQERMAAWWSPAATVVFELAMERLRAWAGDPSLDMAVVWGGGKVPLWRQVLARWPEGEHLDRIGIVSPFWSEEGTEGPIALMTGELRRRGAFASRLPIDLYVEADAASEGVFRPRLPGLGPLDEGKLEVQVSVHAVDPRPTDEPGGAEVLKLRKLHAKVLVLQGSRTTLAYVGSANFTVPGWGFLGSPARAHVEAGLVIVRSGAELAERLLPRTTGKPVLLTALADSTPPPPEEPEAQVPTFLRGIWLEPHPVKKEELRLGVVVAPSMVEGCFTITFAGEPGESLVEADKGCPEHTTVDLDSRMLGRLLVDQKVAVRWWAANEPAEFPVNVALDARAQIPLVPGAEKPSKQLLLSYYQSKISATDLYPPPPGWEDPEETESSQRASESYVDTSRILSYQVREFVEALRGIREALAGSARQTQALMRLAVLGQFSPIALARQICEDARADAQQCTAAAFQMVEIMSCFKQAESADAVAAWPSVLDEGMVELRALLEEIVRRHPEKLGPATQFARYAREIAGWRSRPEARP